MAPDEFEDPTAVEPEQSFGNEISGIDLFVPAGYDAAWSAISIVGLIVGVLVVTVFVVAVVSMVRGARRYREAGIDPLAANAERDVRVMRALDNRTATPVAPGGSALPSGTGPAKTTEERLAEVDRLYAAGTITPSERDAARSRILGSI